MSLIIKISDLFVLIDVSLMTRGSDPVEATKKDTQRVNCQFMLPMHA